MHRSMYKGYVTLTKQPKEQIGTASPPRPPALKFWLLVPANRREKMEVRARRRRSNTARISIMLNNAQNIYRSAALQKQ